MNLEDPIILFDDVLFVIKKDKIENKFLYNPDKMIEGRPQTLQEQLDEFDQRFNDAGL